MPPKPPSSGKPIFERRRQRDLLHHQRPMQSPSPPPTPPIEFEPDGTSMPVEEWDVYNRIRVRNRLHRRPDISSRQSNTLNQIRGIEDGLTRPQLERHEQEYKAEKQRRKKEAQSQEKEKKSKKSKKTTYTGPDKKDEPSDKNGKGGGSAGGTTGLIRGIQQLTIRPRVIH